MPRIPYVDEATAPERVREELGKLPAKLNVFRMLANAPTLFGPWARLGGAILGRMKLDPRLRELVILRVSRLAPSDYEWTQHVTIGKVCGVTDAQIEALAAGRADDPAFDATDRLVLRVTDEAVRDVKVSDATFAEAASRFSHQEVVEILMTAGFYRMLAAVLESTGVEIDAPAGTAILDDLVRRSGDR